MLSAFNNVGLQDWLRDLATEEAGPLVLTPHKTKADCGLHRKAPSSLARVSFWAEGSDYETV